MAKLCQVAFRTYYFINFKYEYFVDSGCASLRNMNFADKFANVISIRKKKQYFSGL